MDDIAGQLNKILSDPQSMAQIQNIMSGLGLENQNPPVAQAPQMPQVAQTSTPEPVNNLPNMDIALMMTKLAPMLSQINQEDNSTRLLSALKPMLSEKKQEKITQAIRILQLMKLMPMIKDTGILSNVLGGLF